MAGKSMEETLYSLQLLDRRRASTIFAPIRVLRRLVKRVGLQPLK